MIEHDQVALLGVAARRTSPVVRSRSETPGTAAKARAVASAVAGVPTSVTTEDAGRSPAAGTVDPRLVVGRKRIAALQPQADLLSGLGHEE